MVRRLTGERRAGHAGTLDPAATGVLPVCLGRGTRVVEYLVNTTKTYRARIEFGVTTDTYDGGGQVTGRADASGLNRKQVAAALDGFRGAITQTPPMYSAVKHKGQPLYKLARAGVTVARKKRKAVIHRLELVSWRRPVATVEVECSKGTYVRALAHDLGETLGCGAYLKNLVRTRCGIFAIEEAVTLQELEEAVRRGDWQRFLHPIDIVLQDIPKLVVDEAGEQALKMGQALPPGEADEGDDSGQRLRRAYARDGRFLAVLRRRPDSGLWQPDKVFI